MTPDHLRTVPEVTTVPFSVTRPLIRVAGFLVCFDLIAAMAASGLFKAYLGEWYILLQPQVAVMILIAIHYMLAPRRVNRALLAACVSFASIGLFEYIATLTTGGYSHRALLSFVFGFLYPTVVVLFVSTLSAEKRLMFWRWFYIGLCTYLWIGFILVIVDGIFWRMVTSEGLGAAVISLRFQYLNSLFSLAMGNANKASNYLLLAMLVAPLLLQFSNTAGLEKRENLRLFRIYTVLAIAMMTLRFSRLIMLLLPVAVYLNWRYSFSSRRAVQVAIAAMGVSVAVGYVGWDEQINIVVQYLLYSATPSGEAQGLLGTGANRFALWSEAGHYLTDPGTVLFGMGYGTFGNLEGCGTCATHNLFLDHWLASGVYGVAILILMITVGSLKALLISDRRMIITFGVFVLLAFREYTMAYLDVTSMGGIMFMVLFYCLFVRSDSQLALERT